MIKNKALAKLKAGEPVACFWLTTGSTLLAEAAGRQGFDALLFDAQHGYWDEQGLLHALQVLDPAQVTPVVRVAWNDPARIGRVLDLGALGVVVPMVNSREEAERAVGAMRYPPDGYRSAGGTRLFLYSENYFLEANPEILAMVMIETRAAVERAEEILSTPGVDCGFIGPGDLALSLGTYGQPSEEHEQALLRVLAAGQKCGVPVGLACPTLEDALKRAEQGFRFLACNSDARLFLSGVAQFREAFVNGLAAITRPV